MIQNLEPAASAVATVPGIRKAAILMIILGDQASAEILRQLDEEEVQTIGHEVARITSISNDQAENVLEEFYQMSMAHDYVLKGGIDYAKKMLNNAFGPEHARKIVDRLIKTLGSEMASFDAIQKADPQQLAKFIHNEHPQTIALILFAPERFPGRRAPDLVAAGAARRRRAEDGASGPDFAVDRVQDRFHYRAAAEVAGRDEPRILRRRARGVGDVQPPGFGIEQGHPGGHRAE
jgi:hypothetical protein